jgi:hypothetical protein
MAQFRDIVTPHRHEQQRHSAQYFMAGFNLKSAKKRNRELLAVEQ